MLQKEGEPLEASAKLREEKLDLKQRLLSWLEELQKAWEVYDLQKKVVAVQSKVSSLREQIDKDRVEKLALKHEVHLLKNNLKNRDKNVELRAEGSCQSNHYDELWKTHEALLKETDDAFSNHIP